MKVSIVVPAYNEAVNIPFLIEEFDKFIKKHRNYEVILVDDGSEDGTSSIAEEHKRGYLKVVRHKRNMGKTQAIISGTKAARGDVIVIFDADLQYDPDDIPRLVELIENGADVATGWKQGDYDKKFVSRIYNSWARRLFDLEIHDMNSVKAFKKELLNDIPLRKDWHRYIVPLAKDAGYKIQEVKVTLRPRKYGSPKYQSKFRILIGLFDLLAVKFQLTFMQKPLLYFGTIGLFSIGLGILTGIVTIILRLLGHGFRPLLYLVILLIISGILFFSLALIGESIRAILDRLEKREL
ncbi:MAG TPA: glycosyltransferase family 2 protein [candidate division WOR-3 bacterium]|uniref:Glycosyltransferase family 2 protein n=1 Tax=candidate division WOR-3 bacterium TaxID=2052148 RepID=A0A9C9ELC6_UNCW3|nr:glycosyltransferase family 2 protein [candidate division WOR-3 bacterium]